jgi:hypothetical protein
MKNKNVINLIKIIENNLKMFFIYLFDLYVVNKTKITFKSFILNITVLFFIGFLIYNLYYYKFDSNISIFNFVIWTFMSLLISAYLLYKFKYLEYLIIINLINIFIFITFISINSLPFLEGIIINCNNFDLSSSTPPFSEIMNNNLLLVEKFTENNEEYYKVRINKQVVGSISNTIIEGVKINIKTALPDIISIIAAGLLGASVLKISSEFPLLYRLAFVGLSTVLAAAMTKLILMSGDVLNINANTIVDIVENNIKNSKHSNVDIEIIPSPDTYDPFIFSVIENNKIITESSLIEILLTNTCEFDILILILIILINIFNSSIVKFILDIIFSR